MFDTAPGISKWLINLDIIVPLKFMSLHKAPQRAGPMQVPYEAGEGQAVLPQCYHRRN